MNKFQIDLDKLKDEVLLDCILQKSAVAVKSKSIKDFYTVKGEPKNWIIDYYEDIREATKVIYKNEIFYLCFGEDGYEDKLTFVFYGHNVYYFDAYYCDCPIFDKVMSIRG